MDIIFGHYLEFRWSLADLNGMNMITRRVISFHLNYILSQESTIILGYYVEF